LLGVVRIDRRLMPGDAAEVTLPWPGPPRLRAATVVVVADENGTGLPKKGEHNECREDDNAKTLPDVLCREPG
jgi:hypothetical protein